MVCKGSYVGGYSGHFAEAMIDDAHCIITLYLAASTDEGQTDGRTIRDNAYALLNRCVHEEGRGGMVTGLGESIIFLTYMIPVSIAQRCGLGGSFHRPT